MAATDWFVILAFCAGQPPPCKMVVWPVPLPTERACLRLGIEIALEYGAGGFTCRQTIPPGAELLPDPTEEEASLWP